MRAALVATTINIPTVLKLYRRLDPDVPFYVAGDRKTDLGAAEFCASIPDCRYLTPDDQTKWRSSEYIGWNTDSRRNIAVLEALKDGAEVIVSFDDDMIPVSESPLQSMAWMTLFDGLQLGMSNKWFDAGLFTVPAAAQRGVPIHSVASDLGCAPIVDANIGVCQGIILGVPDTTATTAIVQKPFVHSATDILRNGFVVHPQAYSVFNSQWTAFRAELAPAFMQHYATQQRNTDIFASMLMRRLMQPRGLYTYFGPPFAFHARQPRPLINDLKAEMWGLEHIQEWADYLARAPIEGKDVIEDCTDLIHGCGFLPIEFKECAYAYYEDCEKVMK